MVAHEVTRLIEPKQNFIEFAIQLYPEFVDFAKQKYIWKTTEGGYGGPTPQERITAHKLLFLAEVRSIAIYRNQPQHEAFLEGLMGKSSFDEKVFDQWWTFENTSSFIEFEDHLYSISLDQFQLIAKTGLPQVDGWIEVLQEMKQKGEI